HGYACDSYPSYAERPFPRLNPIALRPRGTEDVPVASSQATATPSVAERAMGLVDLPMLMAPGNFRWTTAMPAPGAGYMCIPTLRASASIRSFSGATCPMISENPRPEQ